MPSMIFKPLLTVLALDVFLEWIAGLGTLPSLGDLAFSKVEALYRALGQLGEDLENRPLQVADREDHNGSR